MVTIFVMYVCRMLASVITVSQVNIYTTALSKPTSEMAGSSRDLGNRPTKWGSLN